MQIKNTPVNYFNAFRFKFIDIVFLCKKILVAKLIFTNDNECF